MHFTDVKLALHDAVFFTTCLANFEKGIHFKLQETRYPRGILEKISTEVLELLFLGLKFYKLLFFGVAQNGGYFFGGESKIKYYFSGFTGNLHIFFWGGVAQTINYRINS